MRNIHSFRQHQSSILFDMFTRRNLRRNLIIAICLPIVLLGVLVIHQNHDIVFPKKSSLKYRESISHISQEINNQYLTRFKRSTSADRPSEIRTIPFVNNYNQFQFFQSIVLPVIDTKNLERFVHLDLKGAAPKVDYYEKLFPFLKQLGATGLLIEYEDMFPFTDRLAIIKHGFAYTKYDIQRILELAMINDLKVMPLLQVYGHLEYVLKLKEFMHLREDSRYPQVITPCLEESYKLIFGM